jgi:hypothetical protein
VGRFLSIAAVVLALATVGIVVVIYWLGRNPSPDQTSPNQGGNPTQSAQTPLQSSPAPQPIPIIPEIPQRKFKPGPPIALIAPVPDIPLVPPCAEGQSPERLETGKKIVPDEGTSGRSVLEITNGTNFDAAVRLVDNSTNGTSRFVYIRAMNDYTIEGVEPGTYSLLFATGSDWIATCADFQRDEDIREFEQPLVFEQNEEHVTHYKVSLHRVLHGNARTKKIDRKRFLEGDRRFFKASD